MAVLNDVDDNCIGAMIDFFYDLRVSCNLRLPNGWHDQARLFIGLRELGDMYHVKGMRETILQEFGEWILNDGTLVGIGWLVGAICRCPEVPDKTWKRMVELLAEELGFKHSHDREEIRETFMCHPKLAADVLTEMAMWNRKKSKSRRRSYDY